MKQSIKSLYFSSVLSLIIGSITYYNLFDSLFLFVVVFIIIFCGLYLYNNSTGQKKVDSLENSEKKDPIVLLEDISHELKTPLFSIQGHIETLLDGAIEDKSIRDKFLKNISNATDRLIDIISDLDTINNVEKDFIPLHYTSFDLVDLVEDLFLLLQQEAKENKVVLIKNQKPEKALVFADKNKIAQVLSNLISNAIHYSYKGGVVTITFKEDPNHWKITISDIGIGIAKEDIKNIFNRFYQVDKSRSRKKGGAGLGLTIVKKILIAHKKDIFVKSSPGEGSSFFFELDKAPNSI